LYCNRLLFFAVFLACAVLAAGQEAGWVVAAEEFDESGIPSYYAEAVRTIPYLLISDISRTVSRKIFPDEKKIRNLQIMSVSRLKLIRERADLVLERDRILLSANRELYKKRKLNESEKKIRSKEREISEAGVGMQKIIESATEYPASIAPLSVWKSGTELFVRTPGSGLAASLAANGISALLTGTVRDIGGYLFVTVNLETGIAGLPVSSVSDGASYEDLGTLVAALSSRLVGDVAKREPVTLVLDIKPETARVFIDGRLHADNASPVVVFAGEHELSVTAPGYVTANRKTMLENAGRFAVTVNLEKENEVSVSFDTTVPGADLFLHTRHFGQTPVTITIPALPAVGETVSEDVRTFFVFDPERVSGTGEGRLSVKTNKVSTEDRIERTRSVLYWSLGALYVSLPFSMLSYGISLDKYRAYQDDKLDKTEAVVNDVNGWARTAQRTRFISIALGCNVVFQLARYLFAAEQATPRYAEPVRR